MSATDLAWLAGFIDGDGCIMATLIHQRSGRFEHRIFIRIANTSKLMIEECAKIVRSIDPTIRVSVRSKARKSSYKIVYKLNISGKRYARAKILKAIIPHLRLKKFQAELALSCIESRVRNWSIEQNSAWSQYELWTLKQIRLLNALHGRGKLQHKYEIVEDSNHNLYIKKLEPPSTL